MSENGFQKIFDRTIEKRRKDLLDLSDNKKIVTYTTHYAPLELFEASGIEYIGSKRIQEVHLALSNRSS
jgi:Icc-related predicted phosphoesterase